VGDGQITHHRNRHWERSREVLEPVRELGRNDYKKLSCRKETVQLLRESVLAILWTL